MAFDTPLNDAGRLASETSNEMRTASLGNNSTNSPACITNQSKQVDAAADPADASGSGRSLGLRIVFSRSKRNPSSSGSKHGSFVSSIRPSIRSSIRSSFASSGNLSNDDSLEAEHHGLDDLTPTGQQQRKSNHRRSSLLKNTFSSSRRGSAFSSRSSIGSSATGGSRSKRSSAVNRKSSLDLIRASGGEYRPRAEHPLMTDSPPPPTQDKTQRRGSFLGRAMRKLSMGGSTNTASGASSSSKGSNRRAQLSKSKSDGALAAAASSSATPLSASDHGPHSRQRKSSFFGNLRKGSSAKHLPSEDEDPTHPLSLSNHF